ncbi:MAG: glycoside hydrolase family 15 [Candidatus Aenigmarchaeota archaeon]|nr:glycoside hydrolase family 15 [Candidatus Aenigmarchaeota archaeon]
MVVPLGTDHKILLSLRRPSALFVAASSPDYSKAWVRDNIYEAMGLEAAGDHSFLRTYHALFDVFRKHKAGLVHAAQQGDGAVPFKARYHPDTFDEFDGVWGNKQNDAVGLFLFKVGDLQRRGYPAIRDDEDRRILQHMVDYLDRSNYYSSPDHGVWEWVYEKHASSVGACVAGLEKIRPFANVKQELIEKGRAALSELLPRESPSKEVDLALLSLVWPFDVAGEHSKRIVGDVEGKLLRNNGVIRYGSDHYWNMHGHGEPQWPLGLPWLAITHKTLGDEADWKTDLDKADSLRLPDGSFPELYHMDFGEPQPNPNSPLGWAHALYIVANNGN